MPRFVLERTSGQINEAFGKAAHATGDVLHDRFDEAKVLARRGARRAEEFLDRRKVQIKRHPIAAVTGSFVLGLGIGMMLGWTMRRK